MTTTNAALSKSAWISLGIFLSLAAAVGLTRGNGKSAGIHTMPWQPIIRGDVQSLYLGGDSDVTLAIRNGKYEVSAGKTIDSVFQAEKTHLDSLWSALENAAPDAFITARSAKYEELGLGEKDAIALEVKTKKGIIKLLLGKTAKNNEGIFCKRADSNEVYVLKGLARAQIKHPLEYWRKHKLFEFAPDEVESIQMILPMANGKDVSWSATNVNAGQKGLAVEYELDKNIELPEYFFIDKDGIGRVVSALLNARAKSFLDGKDAELSFSQSRIILKTQSGSSVKVAFAKANAQGDLPIRIEGDAQVYVLPGHMSRTLLKGWPQLRDTHILQNVDSLVVQQANFKGKDSSVVVVKENGQWILKEPAALEGAEFDPTIVDAKISALLKLRANRVVENHSPKLKKAGPTVELILQGQDKPLRISFGETLPDEGVNKGQVALQTSKSPVIFGMGQWNRDRYENPVELFKKRAPPPNMGGMGGGMQGLENLPPELRKQLEAQLKGMNLGQGR